MFTVHTSKGTFKVGFHHLCENGKKFTECSLLKEDNALVLKESAYCNPEDDFDRSIGRKLSLERMLKLAIKLVGFNNDDWQNVWREYSMSLKGNKKLSSTNLGTVNDIILALTEIKNEHGNLNVVIPQVGNAIDGNEITWNANVSFVIPDKDDDGKLVVKIL
jgi:hypothetical protein